MAFSVEGARKAIRYLGDVPQQLAALEYMTVDDMRRLFWQVYGETTRSRNSAYLRKRLAWRLQELAYGGLPEATLSKIIELGDQLPESWRKRIAVRTISELAVPPAPPPPKRDSRLPPVGTVLTRIHSGAAHQVTVLDEGFDYAGQRYKTLSAIAKHITGTPWNGFSFFGLKGAAP
jgi:hypothetical protein